jgi:hypothetical protein
MLIVATIGQFTDHTAATNVAFVLAGAATVVVTPLLGRLNKFEVGATKASADFGQAEAQVKDGQLVDAAAAVKKVDAALSGEGTLSVDVAMAAEGIVSGDVDETPPKVLMTQDALASYRDLSADDRAAVGFALLKLGDVADPRAIEPGSGGQFYYVRRVNNRVRLYYRQLDKIAPGQPKSFVVLMVEAKE